VTGQAEPSPSAGQGRPRRSARARRARWAILAALALVGAGAVVAKVGLANLAAFWQGLVEVVNRPPPPPPRVAPPEPPPRRIPDPMAGLDPALARELLARTSPVGQPFRFNVGIPPAAICAAMAEAGLTNPGWSEDGGEWICESDLVAVPGTGEAPGVAPVTLYFVGRGPAENRMTILRFKLNLDDPDGGAAGRDALVGALRRLEGPIAWSMSPAVEAAIRDGRKLSAFDRGVAVEVHPEGGTVERINVVLMLETPAARLPPDRFVPLAPFGEGVGGG
jgi:hypothetical protein